MSLNTIKETANIYGIDKLSDLDLISIILGKDLVGEFKRHNITKIQEIILLTDNELRKIKGLSKQGITKIRALSDLTTRAKIEYTDTIKKPVEAYALCKDMEDFTQEVLRVILLTTKGHVIKIQDVFKGTINASLVANRDIAALALKYNAKSVILVHNHPSGSVSLSKEDIDTTLKVKEGLRIIDVELLDHVIIGKGKYASLKEKEVI